MHDRLTGVPPDTATLDLMQAELDKAVPDPIAAAFIAIEENTAHNGFYNVTLKNFAAPWTNRDQSVFVYLNDYIATIIGMVRDDMDFREILSADIIYTASPSAGVAAYSNSNNIQYEQLEDQSIDLKDNLQAQVQSTVTGLPAEAIAGVTTTRGAAKAFFIDGTNRAMFGYTMLNQLCRTMESLNDTTRAADRIHQDVSRSPGGDSRIFLNNCIGCHTGMDPLMQAFAYYDFVHDADNDPEGENGSLQYNSNGDIDPYTDSRVVKKMRHNETNFPYGYVVPDDKWDNFWRDGKNATLGWDQSLTGSGNGAKSMGEELAHSQAFAQCQVEKVFRNVCLRDVADSTDRAQVSTMVSSFEANNYNIKQVFAESAAYCKGD
ncbi:MAG: hypothetical protein KUG75_06355 [Pseudomonadales bacterium]|nr:hypothetical protein [Pseudomonadales bacterium]